MAVAQSGTIYSENVSDGAGSGSDNIPTITIPSDATAAVVVCVGVQSSTIVPDDLNWDNGAANDFTTVVTAERDVGGVSCYIGIMTSSDGNWPGTGSGKTLYWSFANDMQYGGGVVIVFFISGSDTSTPTTTTDSDTAPASNWTSDDLSLDSGDMALIVGATYQTACDSTPTGAGQTVIQDSNEGDVYWGVGYEIDEDTPSLGFTSSGADSCISAELNVSVSTAFEINVNEQYRSSVLII